MNLEVIVSCVFRMYAFWDLSRLVHSLFGLAMYPAGASISESLNIVVGCIVDAAFVGVAWIYGNELGRWAVVGGRSHVETALKTCGLIYAMSWTGEAANLFTYWAMVRADDAETTQTFLSIVGGEAAVITSVAIALLSIVIIALSRLVGVTVTRAERIVELRKEIE